MSFRLLPQAAADIEAIAQHIAADSPGAARRWLGSLERRLVRLGDMPGIGAPRPEVRPDLRLFPSGSYLILYRWIGDDAEVVRVLHGAREQEALLTE